MFKFKQSLVALAGLFVLVGLIALVTPLTIRSQTDAVGPVKPVLVVNAPSEPVPVTGTVSVGNLGNSPLPVRDVDNPNAGNIVTLLAEPGGQSGFQRVSSSGVKEAAEFTVPFGKALIMTNVSWCIDQPATDAGKTGTASISLLSGTIENSVYFSGTILGSDGRGCESDTLTTGAVIAAGTPIIPHPNSAFMLVHGYLVDVP